VGEFSVARICSDAAELVVFRRKNYRYSGEGHEAHEKNNPAALPQAGVVFDLG
jgi:hypothetical protein